MLQPNRQGHRSYFEAFQRKNNVAVDVLRKEKALTDRSAYLNFLEIQLERVSAACLASQDFGNRIDEIAIKAAAGEEKVLSATKLIRLAQTYSEEQGREQARINHILEVRLASLEQHIDSVGISFDDAATAAGVNSDGVGAATDDGNPGSSNSPGLRGINTAGLSEWMTGVDKQLEDLQNHLFARSSEDHDRLIEGILSPAKKNDQETTEAAESAVKAAAEVMAREECARMMEERVRSLEAALEETKRARRETGGGGDTDDLCKNATNRDRGRRLERCAELARDGLSRSRSPTLSSNPSPPPPPSLPVAAAAAEAAAAVAAPVISNAGSTRDICNDAVLNAVEDGTAVARRAGEVAQEALEAGQKAVERSVRAERLAKILAVRSIKLVKEQHGEVTSALDRLNEKVLRAEDRVHGGQRSARGACGSGDAPAGPPERKPTLPAASAARSRREMARRAASVVPGEARSARRSGRAGGGAALRTDRGSSPGSRRAAPRDVGGETKSHRSVREIREILENSAFADTDNGRRIALGAARTALESILREASPEPHDRRRGVNEEVGEEDGQGSTAGGSGDFRKADELREAIRGAVTILSGISDG
ncbi:unnamed protein product [Hapterophycus canaliculatus]